MPDIPIPTQEDIDSTLASLRAQILSLCEARNAHYSTTSKLPPEILAYIFECISQIPTDEDPHRYQYTWVKEVAHVCKTWRSIALANPRLWSSVLLDPPEWAAQVLQRAKSVPIDLTFPTLTFYLPKGHETHTDLLKVAFANPDLVRSITMPIDCPKPGKVMALTSSLLASSTMPLLERLEIENQWPSCPVPDDLFQGPDSAPQLRELHLSNCVVNLLNPQFTRLHSLELRNDDESSQSCTSLNSICNALRKMQHLEVLELDGIFSPELEVTDAFAVPKEPFALPSLRKMVVKSESAVCLPLFKALKAPNVRDAVSRTSPLPHIDDVASIYSFLSLLPHPQSLSILRSLDVGPCFVIKHSQLTTEDCPEKTLEISDIAVELDTVWSTIPHSNLCSFTLTLYSSDLPPPASVISLVTSLTDSKSLEDLRVPYMTFADIQLLAAWKQIPAFPSLRNLVLDCSSRKPRNTSLLGLRDWLMARETQGLPTLHSLAIINCPHFRASIVGQLKVLVHHFHYSRGQEVPLFEG